MPETKETKVREHRAEHNHIPRRYRSFGCTWSWPRIFRSIARSIGGLGGIMSERNVAKRRRTPAAAAPTAFERACRQPLMLGLFLPHQQGAWSPSTLSPTRQAFAGVGQVILNPEIETSNDCRHWTRRNNPLAPRPLLQASRIYYSS